MSKKLTIAFFELMPGTENVDTFTKLVSWYTKPSKSKFSFCHCEMRFDDGKACSILDGKTVHFKVRNLSREGYKFLSLPITEKQEKVLKFWANKYYEKKIGFNKAGMYWNFLPFFGSCYSLNREGNLFFCAELIVTILQKIKYLTHLKAHRVSPNLLYTELKNIEGVHTG